jgi:hypothetical protein
VAVNQFDMIELFYLFNCRSLTRSAFRIGFFTNPWVLVGSAVMVVLQLLFTYTPVMNRLFQTAPCLPPGLGHDLVDFIWCLSGHRPGKDGAKPEEILNQNL